MLEILLAVYNSRKYLREQLHSLIAQEYQDFQISIRDGGSTDGTQELLLEYQEKYPGKIFFRDSQKSGAKDNFSALLKESSAELVMFCDHDDVWLPQKISRTLAKYREMEKVYGTETPMMVFTDSFVADQNLKIMAPSLFHYQHLDSVHLSLNRLILQNVSSGNTMLVNRALIDLAMPIPAEAVMHDHWIALTAAAMGKIALLNEPTLYYRQHEANVYGASGYSLSGAIKKLRQGRKKLRCRFEENIRQAAAFGKRYGEQLPLQEREMLSALACWNQCGFWKKRKILLKYHILKSGFFRNLGMFILV